MILDELNEFADATSVIAAVGTSVLGDVIDLGQTASDIGNGEDMYLVMQVDTSIIAAAGAGTILFTLVSDSLSTLGGGVVASCTSHYAKSIVTGAAAAGQAVAGSVFTTITLPLESYERYLGILVTVAGNPVTAGAVSAFLTRDVARWSALADAVN
jgi:hypothetical protein